MRIRLLLAMLLLGGCKPAPTATEQSRKLSVVATAYPLADIARRVGDGLVEVSWVVEAGQSLRGVRPDVELRNRLRSADLVLMGDITENWATEGSGSGEHYSRILRLEALPAAREAAQPGILWLDPTIMKEAIGDLVMRLRVLRAKASADITARGDELIGEINAAVQQYQPGLQKAENRRILVLNDDFSPFLKRFSFQPIQTVDVQPTRLTDENIRLIQYVSRQNNTSKLVIPADTPIAAVADLRVRTGLQLVLLDALGTSAAGGRNSYIELLKWDLEQLTKATMLQ